MFARSVRFASPAAIALLLAAVLVVLSAQAARGVIASSGISEIEARQARATLELTKARRREVQQQTASSRAGEEWWRILLPVGTTLLGALVAYAAIVLPLKAQRQKDRELRRTQAKTEAAQGQQQLERRLDDGFAHAVAAVASTRPSVRVGGAAVLQSFLRPDLTEQFRDRLYLAVRAHLDTRLGEGEAVRSILATILAELLAQYRPLAPTSSGGGAVVVDPPGGVDLRSLWLRRADLRALRLDSVDLWRSDLTSARFDGSSLFRARGWKAQMRGAVLRCANLEEARFHSATMDGATFDKARLVSARFEQAGLDRARFRGASLQSAHFQEAKLGGADFRDADVRDTHFTGALMDDATLSSLVLARGIWQPAKGDTPGRFTAHLDPLVCRRLTTLAARRGWQWTSA